MHDVIRPARGSASGEANRAHFLEAAVVAPLPDADLLDLDDALTALTAFDPRKGRVVELRFFGGLTLEETGEVLNVSADTVARDWDFAKTWLCRRMARSAPEPPQTRTADDG